MPTLRSLGRPLLAALAALSLPGCNTILLNAPGDVARQQGDLIVVSTVLMLLIIVPVIALTLFFAWRYRASNTKATYKPDWDHSVQLELLIWAAPLVIIIALGAITWISTHTLDPYRPLERIAEGQPVPEGVEPLEIQVVALDWKWLFLYPEQNIATVNEIAAPVDRPVRFLITGTTVMNSFYIPAMAGMIYAMPGMETKLHAVMNEPGEYVGFSANYSGEGFNGMRFRFRGMSEDDFEQWVAQARASGQALDRDGFLELEKPSEREPVRHYAGVAPGLYHAILNRCVDANHICMDEMMAIDAGGGLGRDAIDALIPRLRGDLRGGPVVAAAVCRADDLIPPLAPLARTAP
ncbi:ubiquinol oxidase subunit II [Marilutibacter alkalisoli]|uniref:Ubiquinol oxidase subunit 2 n=1 Tax=Marilutibacter alkalisoli TaxID=2591633 RepID=A0A514BWL8_9GAMM|nr:ubiquinol oxidase subunit II [Lysobacter alkalisoli]QDH71389.1 ubiquinol oxidase subunit II [Lysobacter alkalisoli]